MCHEKKLRSEKEISAYHSPTHSAQGRHQTTSSLPKKQTLSLPLISEQGAGREGRDGNQSYPSTSQNHLQKKQQQIVINLPEGT